MIEAEMLTADEIEALRSFAKRALTHARRVFGAGMPTAAEIEAERRGEEWWAAHLAEMRRREAIECGAPASPPCECAC